MVLGGLDVGTKLNEGLPVTATGNTCAYAEAAGVVAGAATFTRNPPPPVDCAISFLHRPLSALGINVSSLSTLSANSEIS